MMKKSSDSRCKTQHLFAGITFLLWIFFLPAIVSSTVLSTPVTASSGVEDRKLPDNLDTEPTSSLQEDIQTAGKTAFFSKNTLINTQLFLENHSQLIYWRLTILNINKVRLFHDLKRTFGTLARISSFSSITYMYFMLFIVFATAGFLTGYSAFLC